MTWLERIIGTPCEKHGVQAGSGCGLAAFSAYPDLSKDMVVCASRIQAAEGAARTAVSNAKPWPRCEHPRCRKQLGHIGAHVI